MDYLNYILTILLILALFFNVVQRTTRQRRRLVILEAKIRYLFEKTGVADEPISVLASIIRKAIADGKAIEAIAIYREATGSSLLQAKDAIDKFVS